MFLKRGKNLFSHISICKKDFSVLRIKKSLPLFFILWGSTVSAGLFFLSTLYNHLNSIEQQQTHWLLEQNIKLLREDNDIFFPKNGKNPSLIGLLFIRVIKEKEQVLIVSENGKELNFTSFAPLQQENDIKNQGVWQKIPKISQQISFHTITIGNVSIQGGKDSSKSYHLYRKIRHNTWLFLFSLPLFIFPFCLLIIKKSVTPLITTRKKVAKLVGSRHNELLFETSTGSELDALCQEINRLLQHNRRLTQEIQQSLDNVAHDLRTPMTRLRSVAEYGLREEDPKYLRNALADSLEEAEHVLAMLSVMMSVAEAETGTMRLEKCKINLQESLQHAVTLYEYVAEEKNITISLNIEPLFAEIDSTCCARAWANLIDNAIKYGKNGGLIEIWGYQKIGDSQKQIVLHFADNGIGITKSEQERIWERLYRGDRSRTEQGLGLGLNYVRAIIEAHGGTIIVKSELHKGSEFIITLPKEEC